jgi:hypothetical protein
MLDLTMMALIAGGFALAVAYARLCDLLLALPPGKDILP